MRIETPSVPPYSLWVEGDNYKNSQDSRHQSHGPISKKLLVGIAEYVVWPPTRFGKVPEQPSTTGDDTTAMDNTGNVQEEPRPRSYWPEEDTE